MTSAVATYGPVRKQLELEPPTLVPAGSVVLGAIVGLDEAIHLVVLEPIKQPVVEVIAIQVCWVFTGEAIDDSFVYLATLKTSDTYLRHVFYRVVNSDHVRPNDSLANATIEGNA